jgi:hypothetical protein
MLSSIIDVPPMSYSDDRDGLGVFKEDDAIVADTKPAPGLALEPLHIPSSSRRISLSLGMIRSRMFPLA